MTVLFCTKRCFSERYTTRMLSGQSESDWQKGQSATGSRVSTKKSASAFSGGAMKPRMTTCFPSKDSTLSEKRSPSAPPPLYSSSKFRRFSSPACATCMPSTRQSSTASQIFITLSVGKRFGKGSEPCCMPRVPKVSMNTRSEGRPSAFRVRQAFLRRQSGRFPRFGRASESRSRERRPEHSERPVVAEGRHMPSLPIRHQ